MELTRVLSPIVRRVRTMISRGLITRVNESTKAQSLQLQGIDEEVLDKVERFGEFGFASYPCDGSEAIVLAPQGTRALAVVVAVEDRRYRPRDLAEGECELYTKNGTRVKCKISGLIELGTSPTDFVALAPAVKAEIQKVLTYAQGIASAISGGVPVPNDGGAALKSSIVAALPTAPSLVDPAATEVKAK